jgi:hypothetical protein
MRCPTCGNYAACEPGGIRCVSGHMFLIKRVLPRDHQLSGRDSRNRVRQRDLDANFVHPGRARELLFDRLERLEALDAYLRKPAAVPASA